MEEEMNTEPERRDHWECVYAGREARDLSWFQECAEVSLEFIRASLPDRAARIVDVGAGASVLVDDLLAAGYLDVTVVDLAPAALDRIRRRLDPDDTRVTVLAGDVTTMALEAAGFDFWHDRACFHFLTRGEDRARYLRQVEKALAPGGLALIATFADDGPERCSGLDVVRYNPADLLGTVGPRFELLASRREDHCTPGGSIQRFIWCLFRLRPAEASR
jgi:SAM-dependent methyltransferase